MSDKFKIEALISEATQVCSLTMADTVSLTTKCANTKCDDQYDYNTQDTLENLQHAINCQMRVEHQNISYFSHYRRLFKLPYNYQNVLILYISPKEMPSDSPLEKLKQEMATRTKKNKRYKYLVCQMGLYYCRKFYCLQLETVVCNHMHLVTIFVFFLI